MAKFIKDMLTEKNGDYDPVRFLGIIGFFVYIIVGLIEVLKSCSDFNLMEYATGMSIILGIVAGGITYKYKNESPAN